MIVNKSETGILFMDTETSFATTANFGLAVNGGYISPDNLLTDWNIYCAAWKFLDQKQIHSVSVSPEDPTNDKAVVSTLRDVLENTRLVVGHNMDKFDMKKFNARLIFHSLPPIDHKILTLDTLKAAKKHFAFTSNRLDYLGQFLGVGGKLPHREGNPWIKLIKGIEVKETLAHMEEYCRYDVSPLLEGVYLRLRPYIDHPMMGGKIVSGEEVYCQHCGSGHLQRRGNRLTKAGLSYTQFQCQERHCMGYTSIKEAT